MDNKTLFLAPAEGRKVRHPDGRPLKPEGEAVTASSYWTRKRNDGDVVEAPRKTPKQPQKEA